MVFSEGYFTDIVLLKSSEKLHIWKILHIILLLLLLFTLSCFWRAVKHIYTLKVLESPAGTWLALFNPGFPKPVSPQNLPFSSPSTGGMDVFKAHTLGDVAREHGAEQLIERRGHEWAPRSLALLTIVVVPIT